MASWTLLFRIHPPQGLAGLRRPTRTTKSDQRPSDGASLRLRRFGGDGSEMVLQFWEVTMTLENLQIIRWMGGGLHGSFLHPPQPIWTRRFWLLVGRRCDLLRFSCISFNTLDYK